MTDQIGRLPDPENVHEARYYNGVTAKRLFAWVVDSILIAVLTMILLPLTAFTALFYLPLFWLCIGLAYRILTIANGSATPGMRLAGIELRMEDGERFDFQTAVFHTGLYSIAVAMFPAQLVSIVLMLTTPMAQGLPDLILRTAAIRRSV